MASSSVSYKIVASETYNQRAWLSFVSVYTRHRHVPWNHHFVRSWVDSGRVYENLACKVAASHRCSLAAYLAGLKWKLSFFLGATDQALTVCTSADKVRAY